MILYIELITDEIVILFKSSSSIRSYENTYLVYLKDYRKFNLHIFNIVQEKLFTIKKYL